MLLSSMVAITSISSVIISEKLEYFLLSIPNDLYETPSNSISSEKSVKAKTVPFFSFILKHFLK